jgi:pyruvate kinase
MVRAPFPTRAEVSDVATAVYDGADAVMLSAESAAGEYPVESAAMMDRVVRQAEHDPLYATITAAQHQTPEATDADAITRAARQVAETIGARCVVTYTTSGSTCLRASRERPQVPILGLTPVAETARRLALAWGVHSVMTEDATDFGDMVGRACEIARAEGMAGKGERIVITAGVPFGTPGATNVLRITTLRGKRRMKAQGSKGETG